MEIWCLGAIATGAAGVVWSWVGLALFRREWARIAIDHARRPDVDLCFGPLWVVLWRTALFVCRHPRTLRLGAVYGLHLLVGVDLLRWLDEEEVRRTSGR
ncbi:MAG: hypothetical protein VYE22_29305 [Myxococcota bacterium]|nr:hypothetical protein [Myxococcota bacterium]